MIRWKKTCFYISNSGSVLTTTEIVARSRTNNCNLNVVYVAEIVARSRTNNCNENVARSQPPKTLIVKTMKQIRSFTAQYNSLSGEENSCTVTFNWVFSLRVFFSCALLEFPWSLNFALTMVGRAVRANLDSFSSSILLWETRMFPESNFQVTKHILLSERKFQENIEEKHVMRMKIWKISTRWLPQALILFTSSPAAFSTPIGDSSIQASFRVQHVHIHQSYYNVHLETIYFVLNKICDLWKKIKLCLDAKVTLTSQFCFQILQVSIFFSSYWNRHSSEFY